MKADQKVEFFSLFVIFFGKTVIEPVSQRRENDKYNFGFRPLCPDNPCFEPKKCKKDIIKS